jgi:hypothetical protein
LRPCFHQGAARYGASCVRSAGLRSRRGMSGVGHLGWEAAEERYPAATAGSADGSRLDQEGCRRRERSGSAAAARCSRILTSKNPSAAYAAGVTHEICQWIGAGMVPPVHSGGVIRLHHRPVDNPRASSPPLPSCTTGKKDYARLRSDVRAIALTLSPDVRWRCRKMDNKYSG